jgi:uncharacterized membrane protein
MKELYRIIFRLCSFGCRQIPAHSFFWHGYQLPLCARCLGVLAGAVATAGLFFARKRLSLTKFLPSCLLCLPLVVDGFMEISNATPWPNQMRFLTGILFAFGGVNLALLWFAWIERYLGLDWSPQARENPRYVRAARAVGLSEGARKRGWKPHVTTHTRFRLGHIACGMAKSGSGAICWGFAISRAAVRSRRESIHTGIPYQ